MVVTLYLPTIAVAKRQGPHPSFPDTSKQCVVDSDCKVFSHPCLPGEIHVLNSKAEATFENGVLEFLQEHKLSRSCQGGKTSAPITPLCWNKMCTYEMQKGWKKSLLEGSPPKEWAACKSAADCIMERDPCGQPSGVSRNYSEIYKSWARETHWHCPASFYFWWGCNPLFKEWTKEATAHLECKAGQCNFIPPPDEKIKACKDREREMSLQGASNSSRRACTSEKGCQLINTYEVPTALSPGKTLITCLSKSAPLKRDFEWPANQGINSRCVCEKGQCAIK